MYVISKDHDDFKNHIYNVCTKEEREIYYFMRVSNPDTIRGLRNIEYTCTSQSYGNDHYHSIMKEIEIANFNSERKVDMDNIPSVILECMDADKVARVPMLVGDIVMSTKGFQFVDLSAETFGVVVHSRKVTIDDDPVESLNGEVGYELQVWFPGSGVVGYSGSESQRYLKLIENNPEMTNYKFQSVIITGRESEQGQFDFLKKYQASHDKANLPF